MAKSKVAIVMGSKSDLPVMKLASQSLEMLGVGHEVFILSAHRTPKKMLLFARSARKKGFRVIIAGAGGSAHLPGMIAAVTELPVIGVPVGITSLKGLDSLMSIVQMPKGVPVATVAIDGSFNAGLLAAQIIGGNKILNKIRDFKLRQAKLK